MTEAALEILGTGLITAGTGFLLMAALGLWRLPDLLSRLHTLTKADSAGVALIAAGAACLSGSPAALIPLGLCAVLIAVSGATVGQLIGRAHLQAPPGAQHGDGTDGDRR